jgi:hypothetical protein
MPRCSLLMIPSALVCQLGSKLIFWKYPIRISAGLTAVLIEPYRVPPLIEGECQNTNLGITVISFPVVNLFTMHDDVPISFDAI